MLKISHFHKRDKEFLVTKLAELKSLGSHRIHVIIHIQEKDCMPRSLMYLTNQQIFEKKRTHFFSWRELFYSIFMLGYSVSLLKEPLIYCIQSDQVLSFQERVAHLSFEV